MGKKDLLLADMQINPTKYSRGEMYRIIYEGILTGQDLVDNSKVLTKEAFKHILCYPRLSDEQRPLPVSTLKEPTSESGNVDVYFIGLTGSGKSCLLGGLMAQTGKLGFRFNPRGPGGGGDYAMELRNYLRRGWLPPTDDQEYIQLIDCEMFYPECHYLDSTGRFWRRFWIDEKPYNQKFSFIELSGIKIAEMLSKDGNVNLKDLGLGAEELLKNDNPKLIFFIIDPINEKRLKIGDKILTIFQSDMINKVSTLLCDQKRIRQSIAKMSVILSKSDLLSRNLDSDIIEDCLESQKYKDVISNLKSICEKYGINKSTGYRVGIYPYSIGDFMPGEVYIPKDEDALKILRSINNHGICGLNHRKKRQNRFEIFFERVVTPWFNK